MFVSEDAHYSNMRPGICLGIGMNNVVAIKSDSTGAMCVKDLRKRVEVSECTLVLIISFLTFYKKLKSSHGASRMCPGLITFLGSH